MAQCYLLYCDSVPYSSVAPAKVTSPPMKAMVSTTMMGSENHEQELPNSLFLANGLLEPLSSTPNTGVEQATQLRSMTDM